MGPLVFVICISVRISLVIIRLDSSTSFTSSAWLRNSTSFSYVLLLLVPIERAIDSGHVEI